VVGESTAGSGEYPGKVRVTKGHSRFLSLSNAKIMCFVLLESKSHSLRRGRTDGAVILDWPAIFPRTAARATTLARDQQFSYLTGKNRPDYSEPPCRRKLGMRGLRNTNAQVMSFVSED
jgi:hypothetical protein